MHKSLCTLLSGRFAPWWQVCKGSVHVGNHTLVPDRLCTVVLGVQESCALEVMHTGARQAVHSGAGCARRLCTQELVHTGLREIIDPGGRCARGVCTWEVMLWCQGGCAHWCWACKAVCVHKSSRTAVLGMQGNLCASELMHTNTERARPSLCASVCVCVCV